MLIPGRGIDAGAITTSRRQAVVSPGNPGRFDFDFWQPLEKFVIHARARHFGQRRDMPRPANYGDALAALFLRRPDRFAHERLAQLLAPRLENIGQRRRFRPHCC